MALKMSVKLDQVNVTIPNAYVRVEDIRLNRFEEGMSCMARCYEEDPAGSQAASFKDIPFAVPYDPNGGDAYAQAYAGAKALPEFSTASDA